MSDAAFFQNATSEGISLNKRKHPSPSTSDAGLDDLFLWGKEGLPNSGELVFLNPKQASKTFHHS